MKKIIVLLILCFFITQFLPAQNKKVYVSKNGGTKKILTLGKYGYNYYNFKYNYNACDSLICSGSGYETCKIEKNVIKDLQGDGNYLNVINKAIRITDNVIKRENSYSGKINFIVDETNVSVIYYNADNNGNVEIEIEIL